MDEIKSPHVLYLSYDGLTDPLGQSQILPYLCGLAAKRYRITIISFEKPDRFDSGKENISKQCKKAGILWEPLQYHKNPPVISTLYDLFALRQACVRLFHKAPYQIIHCRSYITALTGLWLRKKYSVRFVFDMRGFWADERVEGNIWNLNNPVFKQIYRFFKRKEKEFLIHADHIISLTENAKNEILSRGIGHAPVTVIPTCVDMELFDPATITEADQKNLRDALSLSEKDFILLYLGSWGTWYLTDRMLDFFSNLKMVKPNARFLIITADTLDLKRFRYQSDVIIRMVPRSQVPLYISLAQVAVCFIKPSYSKKASSATKIGEILAMNVPVVTNPGWGDVDEMACAQSGLVLDQDFKFLDSNKDIRTSYARLYCQNHMSLQSGVERYQQVYQDVLRNLNSDT